MTAPDFDKAARPAPKPTKKVQCVRGCGLMIDQFQPHDCPAPKPAPASPSASPQRPEPTPPPQAGVKHDGGKPPWDLVPWLAMDQVTAVLEHGRAKYSADGWRNVRPLRRRYFAASMRHTMAWLRGEDTDPDSGLPHLAHAVCCLLFILEHELGGGVPAALDRDATDPRQS